MTAWVFERPQAVLSVSAFGKYTFEVAEHLSDTVPAQTATASPGCVEAADGTRQYCPAWRSPYDQSEVWGTRIASVTAGTSPTCPNTGSIACLLLKSAVTSQGQFPRGLFGGTTYIQRLYTKGGSAPTTACTAGQIAQVPYTALYAFYSASP